MILKSVSILSLLVLSPLFCFAQNNTEVLQGKVTFITSNNAYVKFSDTRNISIGDTLRLLRGTTLSPSLIVKNKSSTSCVAIILNGADVKVDDKIIFRSKAPIDQKRIDDPNNGTKINSDKVGASTRRSNKINGSVSAASYSTISSTRGNVTRAMYRLSFNAPQINNSKFSVETYMNYRQTFVPKDTMSLQPKDVFNIYNLALRYDVTPTMSLIVGRKINPKVSSVGAIDGLQAEKFFGNFYAGLLVGFRPDVMDYKFNSDLLQYGGYIGLKSDNKEMYSQTTLGFLEQKNNGNIDRRYTYFQHSSTIGRALNIFSSFELDLYNRVNADSVGKPRLTNFYVSLAYRIGRKVDFSVSYNTRKQIIYYETLKTEIERLLDDDNDIARQGMRFRVNARPFKNISIGLSYSKRFQSNDHNNSDNYNGYINVSKIPWIGGSLSLNANRNTSSYMESNILSFRHSRPLIKMKLDADLYYRIVDYTYLSSELITKQNYYGISLSYRITKKMSVTVLGELAATATEENYRVNTRLIQRF